MRQCRAPREGHVRTGAREDNPRCDKEGPDGGQGRIVTSGAATARAPNIMTDNLHTVWATGGLLGIRCAACDHRAILSPAELPVIRRGNMTRLRDLKLRCGHCGIRGQAPDQFVLYLPLDREEGDRFMRGHDLRSATT